MGRYVNRRAGHVRMPSEIPDGKPAGTEAGPVITYRLSEEELAKYRGEADQVAVDKVRDRLPELHEAFAAGEAESWKGKQALASRFGVSVSALLYRYQKWKEQGGVVRTAEAPAGQPAQQAPEPGPATEPAVAQPVAEVGPEPVPAPGPAPEEQRPADSQPEERVGTEVVPAAPESQPRPAVPPELCPTCIKRDVCPIQVLHYRPPTALSKSELPDHFFDIRIVLSARYVQECSAYRADVG